MLEMQNLRWSRSFSSKNCLHVCVDQSSEKAPSTGGQGGVRMNDWEQRNTTRGDIFDRPHSGGK